MTGKLTLSKLGNLGIVLDWIFATFPNSIDDSQSLWKRFIETKARVEEGGLLSLRPLRLAAVSVGVRGGGGGAVTSLAILFHLARTRDRERRRRRRGD